MNNKPDKPPVDPELRRRVEELIAFKGGGYNEDAVADIIENGLKLLIDVKDTGDVRVIQTALRELRYAFRLFAPYAKIRKVTIFGSARIEPDRKEYQQAVEFGRKIVQAGFMVITGAGPGIMQAGHEGAGPENSFGANIRLPWEQSANPVIKEDKKLVTFKYFFTRKLIFIRHSDAIVLFPGRIRHDGRRLRGAHAHADRQEPAHAAGARGPARRHVLEDMGQARARAPSAR